MDIASAMRAGQLHLALETARVTNVGSLDPRILPRRARTVFT
jgi:hypothetical protein